MKAGHVESRKRTQISFRKVRKQLQHCAVLLVVALAPVVLLSGCTRLGSSASTTGNPPPPSALDITNVQTSSVSTSSSQVVWTTNVAADSAVDFGMSNSYGSSTPTDSAMVTSHQVTLSGLAAGTTYYYQVNSTDSKSNHGKSGGHTFKTSGFSIAGTINPATGGSGATLTLSGAASANTTADSVGNYTFAGLANGTYTVAPSRAGFTFIPSSQSTTVNAANVTGVNFTDTAQTFSISGTISPTAGGSGATVTLSGAASATTTAKSAGAYTFTGLARGAYTITPSGTGVSYDPYAASEPDGDGGADSDVHGGGGRDRAAELPVAEERGKHCRSHFGELHDTGNGDYRQWIDVPNGGDEHGRDGDERSGGADGEPSSGGADDHHAAGEPDGDGGTDGDFHGGGGGYSAAELPVAEERGEHHGGHFGELHDTGNGDDRQRIDVRCGSEQHGRNGDERGGAADGARGSRGTRGARPASEPDGDGGTDGDFHGGGGRNRAAELPVAEERSEHRRSHFGELHDTGNGDDRQWIDVPSGGDEHGRDGDQRSSDADGEPAAGTCHSSESHFHQLWKRSG